MHEPTFLSAWRSLADTALDDALLEWPPDVFAVTNVLMARAEALRFVLSPGGWPPDRYGDWTGRVEQAARDWSALADEASGAVPALVREEWSVLRDREDALIEDCAQGKEERLCQALLTLQAIADEACAGLGVALDSADGEACAYRARGRELLARTGSMSRISPRALRVLPKVRTAAARPSFSRYACVVGPAIEARWHKMPARHRGAYPTAEFANLLLLPWPLRVRESDFRPIEGSIQRLSKEPYGFFEFAPGERLDFDLLDRVLVSARDEAGAVDVVCLPESAIDENEVDELEALLGYHGVTFLMAGVRQGAGEPGRFPGNWLHISLNPTLEKGEKPGAGAGPWFHLRQNKHHRWSFDERQIYQYHLGGALHPHIRWWEAIDVPRHAVQFVEVAELTFACLVCEDLAQNDDVAEVVRAVGPTMVGVLLLDGPQLASRWSARYASVLADDPGSAVLTLTSYGMVNRSRPLGFDYVPVIGLWKDPARGTREIPLEPDAHAVLLTVCTDRTTRRSADGRWPVDNGTHCFDVAVHQIRAADARSDAPEFSPRAATKRLLEVEELTIVTAWAEAVAEVVAHAPERVPSVLAEAVTGAGWRSDFGLSEPSPRLSQALEALARHVRAAQLSANGSAFEALMATAEPHAPAENRLDGLVRRVLLLTLEERRTRHWV